MVAGGMLALPPHPAHDSGTLALLERRRRMVEDRLNRLRHEENSRWVNLRDELENEWDDLVRAVTGDPLSSPPRA